MWARCLRADSLTDLIKTSALSAVSLYAKPHSPLPRVLHVTQTKVQWDAGRSPWQLTALRDWCLTDTFGLGEWASATSVTPRTEKNHFVLNVLLVSFNQKNDAKCNP